MMRCDYRVFLYYASAKTVILVKTSNKMRFTSIETNAFSGLRCMIARYEKEHAKHAKEVERQAAREAKEEKKQFYKIVSGIRYLFRAKPAKCAFKNAIGRAIESFDSRGKAFVKTEMEGVFYRE
jgi:hypothetical protein